MTPRRAFATATCVTFVIGFVLAGYNGTALYVWYMTGQVEIAGSLESKSFSHFFFARSLLQDVIGCLIGIGCLVAAVLQTSALVKSSKKQF